VALPMRLRTIVLTVLLVLTCGAALAQAGSYPKPPTGAWSLGGAGTGFTLKNQGKDVVLSKLHFRTSAEESCGGKPGPVEVLGSYKLKQFHRGGYTAWGVGRNESGTPGPMAAKFVVAGKTVSGSFYLTWNYEDVSSIIGGEAKFGDCSVYFLSGSPK
jgi:hypothetical protein